MKKERMLVCSRCDTFVGSDGLELCPVCGHDLGSCDVIFRDEENEE